MTLYKATAAGNVAMTAEEEAEILAEWETNNIEKQDKEIKEQSLILWKAADDYISLEISGVGLSILATGVAAQKPKAIAVAKWCDSIWTEYYIRKSKISPEVKADTDFSMFGTKPYTVLELREEVSDLWITAP